VHVERRDPRRVSGAAHGKGLGVGQHRLEAGGVGVGQVVADRGLRLQRRACAGHRDVERFVHGKPGLGIGRSRVAGSATVAGGASLLRITNHESRPYRMLMTVWVAWSWVEIICALAWKLRCAVIMLTSCSVRSTVEASRAPDLMRPKSEESGAPLRGLPEA